MKRKVPKLVVATGISGCGRKEYLQPWIEYAEKRGKKIKVYYVGEMMFEHACKIGFPLNDKNILNADRDVLDLLRSAVFNRILSEVSSASGNYDIFLLCIHAFFYWKNHYIGALDKYLQEFSPDMYLTFIDSHPTILERLNGREQWREENLNPEKILEWQGVEVETTSLFANISGSPFFVVPTSQKPSLLYRLIFHPEIETVYSAMPISHLTDASERQVIDQFIDRLDRYFVVFNPLSIEVVGSIDISKNKITEEENVAIYHHVVYRDLDWFVRRADKIVVFWPERKIPEKIKGDKELASLWPRSISSPGASCETHEAFIKTKDVWTISLGREVSPFITHLSTKIFNSIKEFFDFLEKQYPERQDKTW